MFTTAAAAASRDAFPKQVFSDLDGEPLLGHIKALYFLSVLTQYFLLYQQSLI